jgi:integrase
MKSSHLKLVDRPVMRPVGRKANADYRVREHLTEAEMAKLLAALKANRHGHRDWLIGLLIYRHGLRVSEACDLRSDDIDLAKRTASIRRRVGTSASCKICNRVSIARVVVIFVQSRCYTHFLLFNRSTPLLFASSPLRLDA